MYAAVKKVNQVDAKEKKWSRGSTEFPFAGTRLVVCVVYRLSSLAPDFASAKKRA